PVGIAPGTYYIGAIADSAAQVSESNETNNARAGNQIYIGNDTIPPTGSVLINAGAEATNTIAVMLTLSATDTQSGVSQMQFSGDNVTWTTPEPYATTKNWTLPSGDGSKFVWVKFKDVVGNWSIAYSDSIVLDTTPPIGSIAINAGTEATDTTVVTLTVSAADALSGISQMQFSGDNVTWTTPEPYATTKDWTLSTGDGSKTVWVKFQDAADNWSDAYNDSIMLNTVVIDTTSPVTTLQSNPPSPDGISGWFRTAPSISLVSNESGTTYYRLGSGFYNVSRQAPQWIGGGTPLNIRGDDIGSWYDLPFSFTFYGTDYTRLFLSSNGLISLISENSSYYNNANGLINDVAIAPFWTDLRTDARAGDDIYVFQPDVDAIGFRWQAVTYGGSHETNFEVIFHRNGNIEFNYGVFGGDAGPTIGISKGDGTNYQMLYEGNVIGPINTDTVVYSASSYSVYTGPLSLGDGDNHLSYYSADSSGNIEAAQSREIKTDTTSPTGNLVINDGAFTSNPTVNVSINCGDPTSGCSQMQFSSDNVTWTNPEPYISNRSWTFSAGDGQKTLYAKLRDGAGNWSSVYSSSIILNTNNGLTLNNIAISNNAMNTGAGETSSIYYAINGPASITLRVLPEKQGPGGTPVRVLSKNYLVAATDFITWDGLDSAGNVVPDEAYLFILEASDGVTTHVYSPAMPAGTESISCSQGANYDPYRNEALAINYSLSQPGRVDISIGLSGSLFKVMDAVSHASGNYTFNWDGRSMDGTILGGGGIAQCAIASRLGENVIITNGRAPKVTFIKTDPFEITLSYGELTRITYSLSRDAIVTVKLIPSTGATITLLNSQAQTAGPHELQWDGIDRSDVSGIKLLMSQEGDSTVIVEADDPLTGAKSVVKGALRIWR
ncbi:MAG: hypothetical protein AABZ15_11250, partial [Nitrospirota bacterium]